MWVDISFAEVVVDVGGTSTVNVIRKNGSSAIYPTTQSKAFKPHIGHQKCYTVKLSLTAPRYTEVIPATYAGPGQLGSGLPHGKCAWVMQGVNKSLRVELLLTFKHLLTV